MEMMSSFWMFTEKSVLELPFEYQFLLGSIQRYSVLCTVGILLYCIEKSVLVQPLKYYKFLLGSIPRYCVLQAYYCTVQRKVYQSKHWNTIRYWVLCTFCILLYYPEKSVLENRLLDFLWEHPNVLYTFTILLYCIEKSVLLQQSTILRFNNYY